MTTPKAIRTLGAACALVALAASFADIALSMMPGWGPETIPVSAEGWLEQMAAEPLLGLRNLDLLNAGVSLVMVPMFLAVAWQYARRSPALAAVGLVFALVGASLFVGNNVALPMLGLGAKFVDAQGSGEFATLVGAAESLLVRGQHGSLGAAPGFIVSELGTLLVALSMWGLKRTRWLAMVGAAGSILLVGYTLWTLAGTAPLALAAAGGVAMMVWLGGVAWVLFRREPEVNEPVSA